PTRNVEFYYRSNAAQIVRARRWISHARPGGTEAHFDLQRQSRKFASEALCGGAGRLRQICERDAPAVQIPARQEYAAVPRNRPPRLRRYDKDRRATR